MSVDMAQSNYFTIGKDGKIDKKFSTITVGEFYGAIKGMLKKLNVDFWQSLLEVYSERELVDKLERNIELEDVPTFYNSEAYKNNDIEYSILKEMSDEKQEAYREKMKNIKKEFNAKRKFDFDLVKARVQKIIDDDNEEDWENEGLFELFEDSNIKNRDGQLILSIGGDLY